MMKSGFDPRLPSTIDALSGRKRVPVSPWRRLALVLLMLTALALPGYFGVKYGYRWFRERKIDANLQSAQMAADRGHWATARDLSRSVLLARSNEFEAFRLWQRALAELEEPMAYLAAAQLFVDPRASKSDRVQAFSVLARQAPQALTLRAFASLEPEMRIEPEVAAAIIELLVARGEIGTADDYLRKLPDTSLAHPTSQLALVRVLCALPTPARVDEARGILANLIRGDNSREGLEALVILSEAEGGLRSGEPLPDLAEWVERQPEAEDLHRLVALHPLLDERPDDKATILADVAERFSGRSIGTLGTWLVRHGGAALAAEILEEPAKTSSEAYSARIHALLAEKRHEEVSVLLAEPPKGMDQVDFALVQVAALRALGREGAETNAWNRALQEAASDRSRNRFIDLATTAGRLSAATVAERAWVGAFKTGWGRLPLYRDLKPLFLSLARQGRTQDLLVIYRALLFLEPQDNEIQNNASYLSLLHGVAEPRDVMDRLQRLAAEHELPELLSTAALAALMSGDPETVRTWLPEIRSSPRVSRGMADALEGVARVLSGDVGEGEALLAGVDWTSFLPQEVVVFRNLLSGARAQGVTLPDRLAKEPTAVPEDSREWVEALKQLGRDQVASELPALPAPVVSSDLRIPDVPVRDQGDEP